jgi:hypothetical protein
MKIWFWFHSLLIFESDIKTTYAKSADQSQTSTLKQKDMNHTSIVHKKKWQVIYIIQMKNIHGLIEILDYNAIHFKM